MIRAAAAVLAMAAMLGGCVVSQPIVVTYPPDAEWSFTYRDALGESLGGGKASVKISPDKARITITLTEEAFGDSARFEGRMSCPPDAARPGWAVFRATGRWFSGEAFVVSGCVHRQRGIIAPGAAAYLAGAKAQFEKHPLLARPCQRDGAAKRFGAKQVDRVFTWSARLGRSVTPR